MRVGKLRVIAVAAALVACGGSGGGVADAGPDGGDAGPQGTASPGVCNPTPGQTGNSIHVGAYCTPGGGQCAQYGPASACSIDLSSDGNDACITIGCHANGDCAEDACCTGNGGPVNACVSLGCLVSDGGSCPPIPGSDRDGGSDAGSDAGDGG